jgi:outer membrane biosynthesis protein TonB
VAAKSRTHVPLGFVCAIVSAAASGLHYAHERKDNKGRPLNIVHRDISPSNIVIGYDGAVKVLDFGIAKAAMRNAETVVGSLKGKCSYMSPEQCKGQSIDRRSDVYGLGVLLYELATTSRLFKGDNEYLVMDAIVNGKFALPQVRRPDLPNELSSIIMRALSLDPDRRFQTAEELRVALEQLVANHEMASGSGLAGYMRKLFGERPEPWLERGSQRDLEFKQLIQHGSWSDVASNVASNAGDEAPRRGTKTETRRSANKIPTVVAVGQSSTKVSPYETGPSIKFGWEASAPMQAVRNNKLWLAVPALALVAFGLWKFGLDKDAPNAAPAPTPVAPMTAPAAAALPAPAKPVDMPAERVAVAPAPAAVDAEATPTPAPVAVTVEGPRKNAGPKQQQQTQTPPQAHVKKPAPEMTEAPAAPATKVEIAAPAPVPAPAAVAPAPVAVSAPAITKQVAPTPAPAAALAPKEIETQIAMLSNATVNGAASDHARQLSACESGSALHGDVVVSFQIDANGKVVKSQLSSTIKNPKVSGCILKSVQSWKFPRPMAGAAKGVYSISYQ